MNTQRFAALSLVTGMFAALLGACTSHLGGENVGQSHDAITESECTAENGTWYQGQCTLGVVEVTDEPEPIVGCMPGDLCWDLGGGDDDTGDPGDTGGGGGVEPTGEEEGGRRCVTTADDCPPTQRCFRHHCIGKDANHNGPCDNTLDCPSGQMCWQKTCHDNPDNGEWCFTCQNQMRVCEQGCVERHSTMFCFGECMSDFDQCVEGGAYDCHQPLDLNWE
jgi:hypothetical protein